MKTWEVLFKQARNDDRGAQGVSTSDDDPIDDAADEALVAEGEAELEEEDPDEEEESEEESEEEHSEEEQDPEEESEEEEVESEEEEEEAVGFKFKDPKSGDFDFKRINKVVGGPELEKAFKEQTATITRTSQENKALKQQLEAPELREKINRGAFLDRLMVENPVVKAEVFRALGLEAPAGGQRPAGLQIPGLNPEDPLAPLVQELVAKVQTFENRHSESIRERQDRERNDQFVQNLRQAGSKFKELVGREPTEDEMVLVGQKMADSGYMNGAELVPGMFFDLIRKAEYQRAIASRKVKRGMPKSGSQRRVISTKGKRSREAEQDDLWNEHMNDADDE